MTANTIAAAHGRNGGGRLTRRPGAFRAGVLFVIAAAAIGVSAAPARAQLGEGLVAPGNAVVTGFSGTTAPVDQPPNADPFDTVTIDTNGPTAEVVEMRVLGPQGQLSTVTKNFIVTAGQVGQVFGVTLDDAAEPNAYLAATSAYGLSIYVPDGSGTVRRARFGQPGAQFVPGQFGLPQSGGGPGSIWRVDGQTGAVRLFAAIPSAAQGAASLGGLAFDPVTQQLFVADRGTGIIHRFGLDGIQKGTYDHGVEGRPQAGLSALTPAPNPPIDLNSPAFNTEDPSTWGFAPPARRVFALAVRGNRLYYSIAQGPQIWSVGIAPSGAVYANPRLEVEVPTLQDGVEITSIAFDGAGRMYLAERGRTTGDYDFNDLASGGQSRVLRYVAKSAGEPAAGLWRLLPDQYAIGLPPPYANADGGVALGYGYTAEGIINYGACDATLWSTGGRLLDPGDPLLPVDAYPAVDGLQGNSTNLILPQNQPPTESWIIDYDDASGSPTRRGYMGAVAVYDLCVAQPAPPPPAPPAPPPPTITCPPGTVLFEGQCVITACPPGSVYKNGSCVYETCPSGYVLYQGKCIPPPLSCPPGMAFYQGACVPLSCPPGMQKLPNGQCICQAPNIYFNGKCVSPQQCPPGMVTLPGGICWCPLGTIFGDGVCKPFGCPPGQVLDNGFCKPCPFGEEIWQGKCVPKCPPGQVHKPPNGFCGPTNICPPGQHLWNGICAPICPPNQVNKWPNGACGPIIIICQPPKQMWNGKCLDPCPPNQIHKPPNGACGPIGGLCLPPKENWNGQCVDPCPPGQVHRPPNGACGPGGLIPRPLPLPDCGPDARLINGRCVPGQIQPRPPECGPDERLINGRCVPRLIRPGRPGPAPDCGPNEQLLNGQCVPRQIQPLPPPSSPPNCGPNEQLINGRCLPLDIRPRPPQPPPAETKPVQPLPPECGANERLINGRCVPLQIRPPAQPAPPPSDVTPVPPAPPECGPNERLINGRCVPLQIRPPAQPAPPPSDVTPVQPAPAQCGPNERLINGRCVSRTIRPTPPSEPPPAQTQPTPPPAQTQPTPPSQPPPAEVQPTPPPSSPPAQTTPPPAQTQPPPPSTPPTQTRPTRPTPPSSQTQPSPPPAETLPTPPPSPPPAQTQPTRPRSQPRQVQPTPPLSPPAQAPATSVSPTQPASPQCARNEQLVNGQCVQIRPPGASDGGGQARRRN